MGLFSRSHNLNDEISNQLNKFKHHLFKSNNLDKDYNTLLKIINNFFSKKYDVHYKFTYEDLKYEVLEKVSENQKELFSEFCDKLNEFEFDKQKITKQELLNICEKLGKLSNLPRVTLSDSNEKRIEIRSFSDEMFAPPNFSKEELEQNEDIEKIEIQKKDLIKTKEPEKIEIPNSIEEIPVPSPEIIEKPLELEPIKEKKEKRKKLNVKKSKKLVKKTNALENLPVFEIKKQPVKQNLEEVMSNLKRNKKEISEELFLIKKEQEILEKEKKINLGKVLPSFKIFNKQKEDEIRELEHKKQALIRKETLLDEKLSELKKIEEQLSSFSKDLKQDKTNIEEKKNYIKSKEKVISEIRKDMEKSYKKAIDEIFVIKSDLKEKEKQFLGIQDFFQKRENRLSVEESNLLSEKRRYSKSVSNLVDKHLEIAKQDLLVTEQVLEKIKQKLQDTDNKIKEYELRYKDLINKKNEIKTDLKEKQEYFSKAEEEFRSRDDEFEELDQNLEKRHKSAIELEKNLEEFEKTLDESHDEIREKTQNIEVKKLDLKSIERDIDRLKFDIKNQENRLEIREKQFAKRDSSLHRIRNEIGKSIANEKRAVKRIEDRLTKEGHNIDTKFRKTEELGKFYDAEFNAEESLNNYNNDDHELYVKEIKITHEFPEKEIGDPNYLDVLRLLNKARVFIRTNQKQKSRDAYLEIQRIFEGLSEIDKEDLYPQVLDVFKTNTDMMTNMNTDFNKNIDVLIQDFNNSVIQGDLVGSGDIYSELQQRYETLPEEKKPMYFNRIMSIYSKISAV